MGLARRLTWRLWEPPWTLVHTAISPVILTTRGVGMSVASTLVGTGMWIVYIGRLLVAYQPPPSELVVRGA
eukprot:COSAG01_NODE_3660_length_5817_cov_28.686604_3_plen_71_part_00